MFCLWRGIIKLFHYLLSRCSQILKQYLYSTTSSSNEVALPELLCQVLTNEHRAQKTHFNCCALLALSLADCRLAPNFFSWTSLYQKISNTLIPARYTCSIPLLSSSPVIAAAASSLARVVLEWQSYIWLTQCHNTLRQTPGSANAVKRHPR